MEFEFTHDALELYRQFESEIWEQVRSTAKRMVVNNFHTTINENVMKIAIKRVLSKS